MKSQIKALHEKVAAMQVEMDNKDLKIEKLSKNLKRQQKATVRVQQCRIDEEKKSSQLRSTVLELQEQIEKNNALQVALSKQVSILGETVKQQKVALEEKEAVTTRLVTRVSNLAALCNQSNKRMIEDSKKIAKLTDKIAGHEEVINDYMDFISDVRKRENDILAFASRLKAHYERKSQRCLSFFRKPSQASEIMHQFWKMLYEGGNTIAENNASDTLVHP